MGISTWATVESPGLRPFFGEIYGDLSYHSTNFANRSERDYVILTFAPKAGAFCEIKKGRARIEPAVYCLVEYLEDYGKHSWNRNPYCNNSKVGVGGRLTLSDIVEGSEVSLSIFTNAYWVDYHSGTLPWEVSRRDFRIGATLWWPVGEARYSVGIR
jgi:hypothetical protein